MKTTNTKWPQGEIRCLCYRCLQDYLGLNKYHIKRVDPYMVEKDECLRCGRPGYDYLLVPRRNLHIFETKNKAFAHLKI